MKLVHEVEGQIGSDNGAYMLWDSEGPCDPPPFNKSTLLHYTDGGGLNWVKKYDYDSAKTDQAGGDYEYEKSSIDNVWSFLCTDYNVTTNVAWMEPWYYSYTTVVNPLPCVEALVAQAWTFIQQLPGMGGVSLPADVWIPYEGFNDCTLDFSATLEAYVSTYYSS